MCRALYIYAARKVKMVDYIKIMGEKAGDIKLYALSTCGWCEKAKKFIDDKLVEYSYVYVDLLPEDQAEEVLLELGKFEENVSFPTVVFNGETAVIGYDVEALEKLVGAT